VTYLPIAGCRSNPIKKIRPRFPEARSYTARGLHPTVLPSQFDIVMATAAVKLPTVAHHCFFGSTRPAAI
jgi:hypothetical protein